MGEQSIGMASDIAVGRLDAVSSVGDASREAVVVLKIGWCPDLGGRAVVSVRHCGRLLVLDLDV